VNEFEIIQSYFHKSTYDDTNNVVIGVGDDAAIVSLNSDEHLVVCMDTLVSGVHFPEATRPEYVAYKALAVNLSDIAAMGAIPRWITLSITYPEQNEFWFKAFAKGFYSLANIHSLSLIGGDLSRGPLSVTVQVQGVLNKYRQPLSRAGAQVGDDIYISGELGAAAYALKSILEKEQWEAASDGELARLNRPEARVKLGQALSGIANSCIDISDGLNADLTHILNASGVGAELNLSLLPMSTSLKKIDINSAYELAMTGGDDYELCFTLPSDINNEQLAELNAICSISHIGKIISDKGLVLKDENNHKVILSKMSYRHF